MEQNKQGVVEKYSSRKRYTMHLPNMYFFKKKIKSRGIWERQLLSLPFKLIPFLRDWQEFYKPGSWFQHTLSPLPNFISEAPLPHMILQMSNHTFVEAGIRQEKYSTVKKWDIIQLNLTHVSTLVVVVF